MDRLRQDLAFALRLLRKDRAFAATTVLTLAICLGANTAIFTLVRSVLLKPLPYPDAHRLVFEYDGFPGAGVERAGTSVPNYFDRRAFTDVFEAQALYRFSGLRVGTGPSAEGVASMDVTPSFFRVLRTTAARGRLFSEDDGQKGREHVALLAYGFAARMPGGLDGIVGRDLRLNDRPYTVVGVLPPDFQFLDPEIRIWTPLAFTPEERAEDNRWSQNHQAIGRLAPGATIAQAQARLDALNTRLLERAGSLQSTLVNAGYHTRVVSLKDDRQLLQVDPGFAAEHVLTGRVGLLETKYPNDAAMRTFADRALERLRALPGVQSAGLTTALPFSWDDSSSVIIPEGYAPAPGESVVSPRIIRVSPGYLETLRVPLRRGRLFTASDVETSPHVVIIDEPLARRFWPSADPVGKRMYTPDSPEDVAKPGPKVKWFTVVGVVGPVKMKGLVEGEDARAGAYYFPFAQDAVRDFGYAIRTTRDPADVVREVRQALGGIDPDVQPFDVFTLPERVERSLTPRKTPMLLSLGFGLVAVFLASIGIYGVLAYQVSQRTREIGIRMALGCEPRGVLALVLREGAVLVLVGLTVGVAGAVALQRVISAQLFGVRPLDPGVLSTVVAVLALAAAAACLGPARRAARVDPVVALSQQ